MRAGTGRTSRDRLPPLDEDWNLQRFFVRDANGGLINVTEHSD